LRDIKLTLTQDKKRRSPTIEYEYEAEWVNLEREIFYSLQGRPEEAQAKCRVISSASVSWSLEPKRTSFASCQQVSILKAIRAFRKKGSWHVMCSAMEVLPKRNQLPHDPAFFQGFHYVRPDEKTIFERAFRK
jgi:hypothetical protein